MRRTVRETQTKGRWVRAAAGGITGAILVAVPILGLTYCGSGLLANAPEVSGTGEPVAMVSANPFTFDGPATTAAQLQASQKEVERLAQQKSVSTPDDATLLTEWNYTASRGGRDGPLVIVFANPFLAQFLLFEQQILAAILQLEQDILALEAELHHHRHRHGSHHR